MAGERELNHLISRIYELGLDIENWPQMLDEIANFYGCTKIAYMHIDHADTNRVMQFFRHPEPDAPRVLNGLATYGEMPPGSDIWFELTNAPGVVTSDGPILCNRHVPLETVLASDHYNLVVKEVDCFDNLGMRVAQSEEIGCYLSIYSDGPDRMFTDEDIAAHRLIFPHLRRVVDAQSRFGHVLRMASLGGAALDMLDFAVVIVDANAKIHFANDAARNLLLGRDGLEERSGRLFAMNGDNDALGAALRRACGAGAAPSGGAVSVARTSVPSPLVIEALPFDPALGDHPFVRFGFERLAFVAITASERKRPGHRDILAACFGLRPSEARIAELLLTGSSQKEIASILTLSEGTVRWHVKNMLSKLGVRRESELLVRLSALLAPVIRDHP